MSGFLTTFFNLDVMLRYLPDVLSGMLVAAGLGVAVVFTGLLLGLLLACVRTYRIWFWNVLIICFADIFRALPPLVLILLLYFGLPGVGLSLSGPMVLFVVLSLTLAAFAEEIFWAGFLSVERGQWEAGISTGLGVFGTLYYVALPQAVRLAIPPLVNRVLAITKMTALGSVIGVEEVLSAATTAQSFSGSATPLSLAAIAYLILFLPLAVAARLFERRRDKNQGR
ncbi:polar amino acid transport system permease protein [Agrobacterium larrymoorei]|uniref:Polar amino acid transport system permease protein n=1 Tax=Agrobacterium larrymoorei TaxID=160699 RepID=A0AAJ2B7L4_9HYPH|nr:ABC transporter permease subunit [Agrobacterium larrymoorei]MDR6099892.1 polar amino acid transport system permease protein [Agrobacterium larrymoorei]